MDLEASGGSSSVPPSEDSIGTSGRRQTLLLVGLVALFVFFIAAAIAVATMLASNPERTETLRDVLIIFMAFEFLVIGLALIILIVQLARLTALLQNEIKPILESTSETAKTLRGTTSFLSKRVVDPVMKMNSSVAAVRRALDIFRARSSDGS